MDSARYLRLIHLVSTETADRYAVGLDKLPSTDTIDLDPFLTNLEPVVDDVLDLLELRADSEVRRSESRDRDSVEEIKSQKLIQ
ncbi:hypothetical protein [Halobacterium salinarum]|uniref:hypothetical protein n=1 Tax=Halobacterium salinarum TaxID=2242 RepID=UPI0025535F0A|nr:hypothetical protein [Halobacterium salinarum]MDL0128054.1 hypothetical protein [Halobacterium salinarum]